MNLERLMAESHWIPHEELLASEQIPLRLWIGPRARQRYANIGAELDGDAGIQAIPESTEHGPAVALLCVEDIEGPGGPDLLKHCQRALPGRPVICGGSRDRDSLLLAINRWHAFRVLPAISDPKMVAAALRQAHEALSLELTVERTIERLRQKCRELQRSTDELRAAQQQLVSSERMATVGRISGVLTPLLQAQARNLDALERSLGSLGDPPVRRLMKDVIEHARSMVALVEEMLAFSRSREEHSEQDLDAMVERAFGLMQHEPELKQRTLHVACDSGARVRIDHRGMSLALMNLMRGALQGSDPYSLIRVRTAREQQRAVIEINNGGAGLAVADGADMGLQARLGKLAVECQGGSLSCHGSPGAGVRYRVLLPLVK